MLDVRQLLDEMVERDGSDLHLVVKDPPTVRVHGHLVRLEQYGLLDKETTADLVRQIIPERCVAELEEQRGVDFGFSYGDKARFRVAVFYQKETIAINMRLIPYKLRTFEEIGLDPNLRRLCHAPRGLVLVTGPTGSGKTTTLATMIDYINTHRDCHIITIEDPIEYYHQHKMSVVSQRQVGDDVPTFELGVIKALRQDPDVILVGEMRDLATIAAAVRAAETGHLVFSTLHTTGAVRTVDRIIDVFPFDQQDQIRTQLSGNLVAVISQLLLPRPDGHGRSAAFEIMLCTPAIQHMIRDKKSHSIFTAIQTGHNFGMCTLDESLIKLYRQGELAKDEMLRVAEQPAEILQKLGEAVPDHLKGNGGSQPQAQPQQGHPAR
ncbi:MAG: PilT/PilU family type 4a pilus ATPase [Armatimonadota bacterium]|nr:PilT/PilU family type 4a pilus ATPase [bacterium]